MDEQKKDDWTKYPHLHHYVLDWKNTGISLGLVLCFALLGVFSDLLQGIVGAMVFGLWAVQNFPIAVAKNCAKMDYYFMKYVEAATEEFGAEQVAAMQKITNDRLTENLEKAKEILKNLPTSER